MEKAKKGKFVNLSVCVNEMRGKPVMSEKISIVGFTDNDKQCIAVSFLYYYNYYYSNDDDDYDDEDDDADNIRWSTGTESRTGTTSTKLKDAEAKFTDIADICEKRVAGIIRRSCRQQARAKERASSHR
eukprot:3366935-Heterocapsa_arctica.AAC.1